MIKNYHLRLDSTYTDEAEAIRILENPKSRGYKNTKSLIINLLRQLDNNPTVISQPSNILPIGGQQEDSSMAKMDVSEEESAETVNNIIDNIFKM